MMTKGPRKTISIPLSGGSSESYLCVFKLGCLGFSAKRLRDFKTALYPTKTVPRQFVFSMLKYSSKFTSVTRTNFGVVVSAFVEVEGSARVA